MKNFILTDHPNFGEEKVTIENTTYCLNQVKGNGAILTISIGGEERDRMCLSKVDMKALFILLCTEK
jgi:hypothetical protein